MRVELVCIAMAGSQYVLFEREGAWAFPAGELRPGEAPADAARRILKDATGTGAPKLELVDMRPHASGLTLIFRALLTSDVAAEARRVNRMELPDKVGSLGGKEVEEMLKTSLNYKLTRG